MLDFFKRLIRASERYWVTRGFYINETDSVKQTSIFLIKVPCVQLFGNYLNIVFLLLWTLSGKSNHLLVFCIINNFYLLTLQIITNKTWFKIHLTLTERPLREIRSNQSKRKMKEVCILEMFLRTKALVLVTFLCCNDLKLKHFPLLHLEKKGGNFQIKGNHPDSEVWNWQHHVVLAETGEQNKGPLRANIETT